MKSIRIEIGKAYKEGCFNLRVGDIVGSSESINVSKEEVISEIKECIDELDKNTLTQSNENVNKEKNTLHKHKVSEKKIGCGKDIPVFYSEMLYVLKCGEVDPLSKNVIYCDECKVLAKSVNVKDMNFYKMGKEIAERELNSRQENDGREAHLSTESDLRVAPRENSEAMQSSAKSSADTNNLISKEINKDYAKEVGGEGK